MVKLVTIILEYRKDLSTYLGSLEKVQAVSQLVTGSE